MAERPLKYGVLFAAGHQLPKQTTTSARAHGAVSLAVQHTYSNVRTCMWDGAMRLNSGDVSRASKRRTRGKINRWQCFGETEYSGAINEHDVLALNIECVPHQQRHACVAQLLISEGQ